MIPTLLRRADTRSMTAHYLRRPPRVNARELPGGALPSRSPSPRPWSFLQPVVCQYVSTSDRTFNCLRNAAALILAAGWTMISTGSPGARWTKLSL